MKFLLSLIVAVGSFLIFTKIIHHIFLGLLIGAVFFILFWRLYSFLQKKFAKEDTKGLNATTSKVVASSDLTMEQNRIIEDGIKKLVNVRNLTRSIPNNSIAMEVQEICKVGMDIFDDLKQNPEDIRKARQFLNYYLDTFEKIVKQYADLSQKKDKTPELEEALVRVEGVLDSIKDTYKKQLVSLTEDDILDLNVEISVLEKTIKYEG